MELEKVIKERTAVRSFKNDQIDNNQLTNILEAGRLAPTAKNLQPQRIIVVQSEEYINKIDKISPCRYNAPTVLVVCSNKDEAFTKDNYSTYEMDACIVATHMMLEATNVGLGSVWVELFDKELLKQEFNLDNNIEPVCLLMIGYKTDNYFNPMHELRKDLAETVQYL